MRGLRVIVGATALCFSVMGCQLFELLGALDELDSDEELLVQKTIGAGGGEISAEGMTLSIPPDALSADTEISVYERYDAESPGITPVSLVFRFAPDGLEFKAPVRISIKGSYSNDAAIYWTKKGSETTFEPLASEVVASTEISATVSHFSMGFVGLPLE